VISLVVGTDGKAHNLKVVSAPNHDYDEAALKMLQGFRFKPATCDGEPMETKLAVETDFHVP
jgi:TonB family protein